MNPADFQTTADQFLNGLKRSVATIRAYRADLVHLQRWLLASDMDLDATALEIYFADHSGRLPPRTANKRR